MFLEMLSSVTRTKIFLEKARVAQSVKTFSALFENLCSLPCSQKPKLIP